MLNPMRRFGRIYVDSQEEFTEAQVQSSVLVHFCSIAMHLMVPSTMAPSKSPLVSARGRSPRTKTVPIAVPAGRDGKRRVSFSAHSGYQSLPTHDEAEDAPPPRQISVASSAHVPEGELTILDDSIFQVFMALMIMGNAIVIGLETDIPTWPHWDLIENLFLLIFASEMVLKMCLLGLGGFFDVFHHDAFWNIFDLFIVGLGVLDFLAGLLLEGGGGGDATLFRIIRLLRILRIIRIIKFLKQLYMLAFGLVESFKAIFWVAILMGFVLYVCSIVLVKSFGRLPPSDQHSKFLSDRYSCIIDSMFTLFGLMTSPNLSVYFDQPGLFNEKPTLAIFLVFFITFGSFGIIAMLSGVISESMLEKNEMRKEDARQEQEAIRRTLGASCDELFDTLTVGEDGMATVSAVLKLSPKLANLLTSAGGAASEADVCNMIRQMDMDVICLLRGAFNVLLYT